LDGTGLPAIGVGTQTYKGVVMTRRMTSALAAGLLLLCSPAGAQLAISGNDGKQPQLGDTPKDIKPDSVTVIDLGSYPPKIRGQVEVPFSMIGEPTSVAVAHSGRFALVTASQKYDTVNKVIADDKLSVVDLTNPDHPNVIQTLSAGQGPSGVSINRNDTLAVVANVWDGTVAAFTIRGKALTPAGKIQLDAKLGPVDAVISPDSKTAMITQRHGNGVWRLAIRDGQLSDTGVMVMTGGNPYGGQFSADGRYFYNTNLLGNPLPGDASGERSRTPRIGTVTVIDLKTNKVVNTIEVGPTPEHLVLSPDGKYMEVTVVNGSSSKQTAPGYHDYGLMKVFRVEGAKLTQVAETKTGRWGQGAAWSRDGKLILLQGAIDKAIEVYRFDGSSLTRDSAATLSMPGRPGAIATAYSR
jgi:DNA-binding beta-propeller fold protein YncE